MFSESDEIVDHAVTMAAITLMKAIEASCGKIMTINEAKQLILQDLKPARTN